MMPIDNRRNFKEGMPGPPNVFDSGYRITRKRGELVPIPVGYIPGVCEQGTGSVKCVLL